MLEKEIKVWPIAFSEKGGYHAFVLTWSGNPEREYDVEKLGHSHVCKHCISENPCAAYTGIHKTV